jgi:hypothetical protein
MKKCSVSKKLRKYAYAKIPSLLDRADLLHYADEVKALEDCLNKIIQQCYAEKQKTFSWQQTFKCATPWEAESKHKAEIDVLLVKLAKMENMLILMMPVVIRDDVMKAFNVRKTEFWRRTEP